MPFGKKPYLHTHAPSLQVPPFKQVDLQPPSSAGPTPPPLPSSSRSSSDEPPRPPPDPPHRPPIRPPSQRHKFGLMHRPPPPQPREQTGTRQRPVRPRCDQPGQQNFRSLDLNFEWFARFLKNQLFIQNVCPLCRRIYHTLLEKLGVTHTTTSPQTPNTTLGHPHFWFAFLGVSKLSNKSMGLGGK